MAEFSLEALKNEIVADTEALGYKNTSAPDDWKEDQEIADLINAKTHTTLITKELSTASIKAVVLSPDYLGLGPSEESYLNWVTAGEMVELAQAVQDAIFKGGSEEIWGPQNVSGQNILDLATEPASRAEELWGEGRNITLGEIGRASNLV